MMTAAATPANLEQPTGKGTAKPIGALVIGGDFQGLGIVRSLGRRGVPVCVIDDELSISRYSRYTTHSVAVRSVRQESETIDAIIRTGRRLGLNGWVIYPTRDETVAALAKHREELATYFRVPTPVWETTRWVWDKRNTYRLAKELGIPTPQTWYPRDISELESIDGEPPFVIKPAIKEHFVYATKKKAWQANSRAELLTLFEKAAAQVEDGEVMVQELIPGNGQQQFSYCAFYKDGQSIGSMTARRARQHPPVFGTSTFVETIDLPVIEAFSDRFLQAIGYYGLVEIEYKLDPRNGQYKLLDVNGRTWGFHSLGAGAGVDFPYLLYADQVGESVEPARARAGVRWIRLVTDIPTAMVEILSGRQDISAYLKSLRRFDVTSVFSRNDLAPGLAEFALLPYLAVKRGF
jgi:D-aspartate ligase